VPKQAYFSPYAMNGGLVSKKDFIHQKWHSILVVKLLYIVRTYDTDYIVHVATYTD
jgi:hypothetical protein